MLTAASFSLLLAGCGADAARSHPLAGLPEPPGQTVEKKAEGLPISGSIAVQLPFAPIEFSLDTTGKFSVKVSHKIVTPYGQVSFNGEVPLAQGGGPGPADPQDASQLFICQKGTNRQVCEAYQLGSGRTMRIEQDGQFVREVSRDRVIVEAASGSKIAVIDAGPPKSTEPRGPAEIAVKKFHFHETSAETVVDLEADFGGVGGDISYDHVTGELKAYGAARIARSTKYDEKKWNDRPSWLENFALKKEDHPVPDGYLPGEKDCAEVKPEDWRENFAADELGSYALVACIKTAEADLGYLVVRPEDGKPRGYHVYSRIWVRR
ncbi:hypothetical protein [Saccharothrix xinjiangensis]|uniref:Uncharacterized protein n=1 Tax=Saccharothrix xinjiangensis TaxID=204798 RepID=A0ABV9XYN3_9PSEU